jgi:hypothetical protein
MGFMENGHASEITPLIALSHQKNCILHLPLNSSLICQKNPHDQ